MEQIFQNHPELLKIIESGNKSELIKFLTNNPNLASSILSDIASLDEPAKKFKLAAIDKMFDEQDYVGAIIIINKGLELKDKINERFLYSLRSECNIKLLNYTDALIDINSAIQSLKQNDVDDYYQFSKFLKDRSEIKKLLNDPLGANQDILLSKEYEKKDIENNPESDEDDDLPF